MSDNNNLSSYINEIRAYDLYTLTSSSSDLTTLCSDFISPGQRVSPQDLPASEGDSHFRSKHTMKRISGKKYSNLPVLQEEDGGLSKSPESSGATGISKYFGDSAETFDSSGAVGGSDEKLLTKDVVEGVDNVEFPVNDDDDDIVCILDDQTSGSTYESWVDLSKQTSQSSGSSSPFTKVYSSPQGSMSYGPSTPERVTPPPFGNGEEYLRLLREAQKESNQSSARVSLASSRRDTPRDSPKSPPNSPNTEAVLDNEEPSLLKGVYINYYNREGDFVRVEKNVESDWIWDWSSRPDQTPPKQWKFVHPHKGNVPSRRGASIRRLMVGNSSLFSRDVLYTLFITNVLSLILGTGIGMWLSRKSGGGGGNGSNVPLAIIPIN